MTKKMLIDATHAEETRVVVLDGNRLEEYDVETATKKQLKGNIYLAKVVRVEPSLQAAFVEYGGNRHGFLAFGEIHPDYYQIPVADREKLVALQEEEARAAEAEDLAADANGHDVSEGRSAPLVIPIQHLATPYDFSETPSEERHGDTVEPDPASFHHDVSYGGASLEFVSDVDEIVPLTEVAAAPEAGPSQSSEAEPEPDQAAADEQLGADSAPEMADSGEGFDRFETPANDAPPPETLGGADEIGDDVRPRHENPRFMRNYKIQEVIRRRQILLIQVVKEERGNKGAALTTYISLAGRYSVLMPNSPRGGGISRKITSGADRRRLREVAQELDIPRGMGLIIRTAGANRPKPEIKRDGEYLLRLWDDIRELTLKSVAPSLIYEEASLIKRAIRDVDSRELDEILVDGEPGWRSARDFMRMLMPSHARKVQLWTDPSQSLFARHQVEAQLDAMQSPTVQLRSGGYLVINQTEALVAIDVNSGRATRERDIADTAIRTNLEAVDEVARQLRLRDLAGLIVIDLIDMESKKHNAQVERRLKEALKNDRARIQIGHISHFGLMEMSRQRLRPSLAETSTVLCTHCGGTGHVRSTESAALHVLRAVEEEGSKRRTAESIVHVATPIVLYILNHKRDRLSEIEHRCAMRIAFAPDDTLLPPQHRIERLRSYAPGEAPPPAVPGAPVVTEATIEADLDDVSIEEEEIEVPEAPVRQQHSRRPANAPVKEPVVTAEAVAPAEASPDAAAAEEGEKRRRRRRRRRRRGGRDDQNVAQTDAPGGDADTDSEDDGPEEGFAGGDDDSANQFVLIESPATINGFAPSKQVFEAAPTVDLGTAPQPDLPDLPVSQPAPERARPPRPPRKRPVRGGRRDSAEAPVAAEISGSAAPQDAAPPSATLENGLDDGQSILSEPKPKKPARRRAKAAAPAEEPEPEPDHVEPVTVEHVPGGGAEVAKPILVDANLAVERKRGWWRK